LIERKLNYITRLYIHEGLEFLIKELEKYKDILEIYIMPEKGNKGLIGTLWRFLPFFDKNVNWVTTGDSDDLYIDNTQLMRNLELIKNSDIFSYTIIGDPRDSFSSRNGSIYLSKSFFMAGLIVFNNKLLTNYNINIVEELARHKLFFATFDIISCKTLKVYEAYHSKFSRNIYQYGGDESFLNSFILPYIIENKYKLCAFINCNNDNKNRMNDFINNPVDENYGLIDLYSLKVVKDTNGYFIFNNDSDEEKLKEINKHKRYGSS